MKTLSKITLVSFLALFALACDPGIEPPDNNNNNEECDPGVDDCSGETICIVDQCEEAFGRFYTFSDFATVIDIRDANGDCIDADCSPPDAEIELLVDGELILATDFQQDVENAFFEDSVEATLLAGSDIEIRLIDDDFGTDTVVAECLIEANATDLRGRTLTCTSDVAFVVFSVNPD